MVDNSTVQPPIKRIKIVFLLTQIVDIFDEEFRLWHDVSFKDILFPRQYFDITFQLLHVLKASTLDD